MAFATKVISCTLHPHELVELKKNEIWLRSEDLSAEQKLKSAFSPSEETNRADWKATEAPLLVPFHQIESPRNIFRKGVVFLEGR